MKNFGRYFLIAFILVFLYVAYLIVKPYLISLITASIIAYICYPWYTWLKERIKKDWVASLIISVLIVVMILIPLVLVINFATQETRSFYYYAKDAGIDVPTVCEEHNTLTCLALNIFDKSGKSEVRTLFVDMLGQVSNFLVMQGSQLIVAIPNVILNIFITIFVIYYLLKDGEYFLGLLKGMMPLDKAQFNSIKSGFDSMIKGIVFGQLIISLLQGALAAIGYLIAGLNSVVFLGLLTAFLSLIPVVGTAVVWGPAGLFLLLNGMVTHSNSGIAKGIFLLIYGALVVSTIDNLVRPKLISEKTKVHPVIILIGVLGGLKLFGIFGFILGPVILTASIMLIEVLKRDIHEAKS